jgi:hypothetical protein
MSEHPAPGSTMPVVSAPANLRITRFRTRSGRESFFRRRDYLIICPNWVFLASLPGQAANWECRRVLLASTSRIDTSWLTSTIECW